jgi:hypothetical protein
MKASVADLVPDVKSGAVSLDSLIERGEAFTNVTKVI